MVFKQSEFLNEYNNPHQIFYKSNQNLLSKRITNIFAEFQNQKIFLISENDIYQLQIDEFEKKYNNILNFWDRSENLSDLERVKLLREYFFVLISHPRQKIKIEEISTSEKRPNNQNEIFGQEPARYSDFSKQFQNLNLRQPNSAVKSLPFGKIIENLIEIIKRRNVISF